MEELKNNAESLTNNIIDYADTYYKLLGQYQNAIDTIKCKC